MAPCSFHLVLHILRNFHDELCVICDEYFLVAKFHQEVKLKIKTQKESQFEGFFFLCMGNQICNEKLKIKIKLDGNTLISPKREIKMKL